MLKIVLCLAGLLLATSAEAKHYRAHNFAHGLGAGLAHVLGLSSECRTAASLGGPCGCFASEHFFGHSVRELWPVSAWYKFPHVSPAPGTAAIWPGRHVAVVLANNGNGTVTTLESWGTRTAKTAGLVFVSPR